MGRHSDKSEGDANRPGAPIPPAEKDEKGKPDKGRGK